MAKHNQVIAEWSAFDEQFTPIQNPFDKNASLEGVVFSPRGEEGDYVREIAESNPEKVWSYILSDYEPYIANGMHVVNLEGYIITEEPAPEDTSYHFQDRPEFEDMISNAEAQLQQLKEDDGELTGDELQQNESEIADAVEEIHQLKSDQIDYDTDSCLLAIEEIFSENLPRSKVESYLKEAMSLPVSSDMTPCLCAAKNLDGEITLGSNYQPKGTKLRSTSHYDHGAGIEHNNDQHVLWVKVAA